MAITKLEQVAFDFQVDTRTGVGTVVLNDVPVWSADIDTSEPDPAYTLGCAFAARLAETLAR